MARREKTPAKKKRQRLDVPDGERKNKVITASDDLEEDEHPMRKNGSKESSAPKSPKRTVQETCDLIAEMSESILEDPQSAFSATVVFVDSNDDEASAVNTDTTRKGKTSTGPSKMRQLLHLAQQQSSPEQEYTAQLAIMSLLAIFKDILPSYRIRLPTEQEMAVKVSKDTKKIWDYEKALLQHYQQYLKLLEKTWEKAKARDKASSPSVSKQPPSRLAITSMLSLCELLKTAYTFNFRSNLLTAVVRQMNTALSVQVSDACCQAVEHVFEQDKQGEVSMEAARQVSKLIKERHFRVRPSVLRTFAKLPLRAHADEAQAAKLAAQAQAKKRKRGDKELAGIESEMKEGQATVDKILLARCQSETLQSVTLTYFRILKSEDLKASHIAALLPPALEGLAKFAHLINMETVLDLLDVLKGLLKNVDALPFDAALNCILTAFETLQGPGRELKIDVKEYVVPLYSQLPRLCVESNSRQHTHVVLQCLSAAFLKRREFSSTRLAAFVKQIMTVAMHTPPCTSVSLMAMARQLLQRYPSVHPMLENEDDVISVGQYNPTVTDPEHSNPFATSAWELATLRFHYHSNVATQARSAATGKLLQLPAETPETLQRILQQDSDNLLIGFSHHLKPHPLAASTKDGKKNHRRQQVRFIKPRVTRCKLFPEE